MEKLAVIALAVGLSLCILYSPVSVRAEAPTLYGVQISGSILTPGGSNNAQLIYAFKAEDGKTAGSHDISWYVSDVNDEEWEKIDSATGETFEPLAEHVGMKLKAEIIPIDSSGTTGTTYVSDVRRIYPAGSTSNNLSISAVANASSHHDGYEPSKAIDGNKDTRWASRQGTDPGIPWLSIDLGAEHKLNRIELHPRTDLNEVELRNFVIEASNAPDFSSNTTLIEQGNENYAYFVNGTKLLTPLSKDIDDNATYRYIRLRKTTSGYQAAGAAELCVYSYLITNMPPKAKNLAIVGNAIVGDSICAEYDFIDDSGVEENSRIQWYASALEEGLYLPIPSKNTKEIALTSAQAGAYIKYSVIPCDAEGAEGAEAMSEPLPVFDRVVVTSCTTSFNDSQFTAVFLIDNMSNTETSITLFTTATDSESGLVVASHKTVETIGSGASGFEVNSIIQLPIGSESINFRSFIWDGEHGLKPLGPILYSE